MGMVQRVSTSTDRAIMEAKEKKKHVHEGPPPKDTTSFFKQRIDHMLKNADKPMVIPDRPQDKRAPRAKEFFPNVMGR